MTSIVYPEDAPDYVRGPGHRRRTTTGPPAAAPPWWVREAERIGLDLAASGRQVTVDDLHARLGDEPGASGAAFGQLFARLAREGKLREVGWTRSRRPDARGRRVVLWGGPRSTGGWPTCG
ncbi:hypothetical protein E9529_15750 [Blastococcus sp. KM273128]|uniref:hypothetical protein n=1 Tax=Blastococcus sp. KM273128 TaxID=2570314 RepID=UPI001F1DBD85|nr:hypothetical protein [Blastococcus sp. KM273128]MCF6745701.1 hypothetical protein [Blastococcus sp. KM273128]